MPAFHRVVGRVDDARGRDGSPPPLRRLVGAPLCALELLELFLRTARAVAKVHARGVVHGNLTPESLSYDSETHTVRISGGGKAKRRASEPSVSRGARLIEGSLPYISPEQTGRMNRAVDSRSDLYSLGVVFYELLTGRLPFVASDPMEWVHAHVARKPEPIVVESVPSMVTAIVLKLLQKVPDARYQSATGLAYDLERCLAAVRNFGDVPSFPLGERDISDRFLIPQRLYGREKERTLLVDAFDRVAASGTPELVLVAGYSGIGKTSVVRELEQPVVARSGVFISGKFDQYARGVPYATLAAVFRELVLEVLTEPEEQVEQLRQQLGTALGRNGAVVLELIPELALLLGPQPGVPDLPPNEAEHRLRGLLSRVFGVFATARRPLALFLDDLQWADPASLRLLGDLVTEAEPMHLLLVGAYRDNEVDRLHPLRRAIDDLERAAVPVREIALGPLSPRELDRLVADTVHATEVEVAPLSALVYEKTQGNPFFVLQLLGTLHGANEIEFDRTLGRWRWDVARIRARGYSDNVAQLLAEKVASLPPDTRRALGLAACLAGTFDAETFAALFEGDHHVALGRAVEEGLLIQLDDEYSFSHDRVEEAAYALVPADERAATHLTIGRKLLARTAPGAVNEACFGLVHQLNRGASLITSRQERETVAELDLVAGLRAQRAAAHSTALGYFRAGVDLLDEDTWERRRHLAFSIELHLAECEFLTGDLERAEACLTALSRRAQGLVEAAGITCLRVAMFTTKDEIDRAVGACIDYLRRTGIEWALHPPDEAVSDEYDAIWRKLGDRAIEDLIRLPAGEDPEYQATMDVLKAFEPPALFTDDNLRCLVVGQMVNLTLEHGTSCGSPLAYTWLGTVLGSRFGDFDDGFRFGKLGLDLLEKRGQQTFRAPALLGVGARVSPWSRPLSESIPLMRRGFAAARESGDLTFASYACNCTLTLLFAKGAPLPEVQREAEDALAFVRRAKFGLIVDVIVGQLRLIQALRDLPAGYPSLDADEFQLAPFEKRMLEDPRLAFAAGMYWVRKLQSCYMTGDYDGALEAGTRAEALLWTIVSFFETAEFHFYRALALAARCNALAPDSAWYLQEIERHHARLNEWRANCPANFTDRARLVEAEMRRLRGENERAATAYEQAIRAAREQHFLHHEALAYEVAARFYDKRGFEQFAETYFREARTRYAQWGAAGKVRALDERLRSTQRRVESGEPSVLRPEQLDLLAVVKASQTISGELTEERLLDTLLRVTLEHGGARRARLILLREGKPALTADSRVDESDPVPGEVAAPQSILNYVQRTSEVVLLEDASVDRGRFGADPYFAAHHSRSVSCLPIRRQAALIGLMYMENDLVPGAFTPERLQALSLVAGQAAISLENARLYAELRKENAERMQAEAALLESRALLQNVIDNAAAAIYVKDLEGRYLLANRYIAELHGMEPADVCGKSDPELFAAEEAEAIRAVDRQVIETGTPIEVEETVRFKDGVVHTYLSLKTPLTDAAGVIVGMCGISSDITERIRSEAALRRSEEQLRQAPKMEAIGNLAGGIAHDFNNLLSIILGYSGVLVLDMAEDDPRRADIQEMEAAGVRASELTRQLLAFARKQILQPKVVNLNDILRGVERMLGRVIGEDIELNVKTDPRLGKTKVDPGQVEQILVNLAVNSRDAMPEGGKLTIETANVELDESYAADHPDATPGPCVMLAVTDTGIGMNEATRARIFEPFFTTKEKGKGTGLGLSTVLGIVQQSGGTIWVYSEPGKGTSFKVYLPRTDLRPVDVRERRASTERLKGGD